MRFGFSIPLSSTNLSTVVPNFSAIAERLSPDWIVYVMISIDSSVSDGTTDVSSSCEDSESAENPFNPAFLMMNG